MFRITTSFIAVLLAVVLTTELSAQDSNPRARDILNKYVQAVGGYETLSSVETMKAVSTVVQHSSVGDKESSAEYTNTRMRSHARWVNRSSVGTDFAFDGSKNWMKSKNGKPKLHEANRYPFDCRDPITYPLHLVDFRGSFEFVGETELRGKPAYRLKVEPVEPEPTDRVRMTPRELVFDSQTGLLLKIVHESKTVELGDYRDVGGILVPFQYSIDFDLFDVSSQSKVTISSMELDIELDENLLSLGDAADD